MKIVEEIVEIRRLNKKNSKPARNGGNRLKSFFEKVFRKTKEDENKNGWFLKFMGGDGTELVRTTMQPVYDFINKYKDKPFFIWFAPELPHYPFDAPAKAEK